MRRFVFIMMAVLIAMPVMAQQQYGSLAGSVVDNQKQALPGVSVTLNGQFMQGTRTAVTDAQGRYRFVPVPPGGGYAVKFDLQGFNSLEKTDLVVAIGKETSVSAEMSLSQFAETITVTAEKIVVDTSKSTVDTTVDWKIIDTLATNRNFQNLMQMAPGVKSGNNPYVHGQSNDSNVYMIDGVDTTDPRTGTWGTAINWDTIQEAQVQTGGFQAEFGRATGGIVNLVTKSGGNNYSFTARGIWQRVKWAADPGIDSELSRRKSGAGRSDETRPSFTLGGPIIKDGLWFYLAYERRANHRAYTFYPTLADAQTLPTPPGNASTNYQGRYFSGKLTYQVTPGNSVVGYFNEDPITLNPLRQGWYESGTTHYSPSMDQEQFQGGNNWSLQWYGIMTPSFFIEAKYQHHQQELNVTPMDKSTFGQVPYLRQSTPNGNFYFGSAYYDYKSKRARDGATVAGSYYIDSAAGSHQIKVGVEYLKLKPTAGRIYNPLGYYALTSAGVPSWRYTWTDQVSANTTEQTYEGVFVQDQWKFGKATLNIGLRAESTKINNNEGRKVLSFGLDKAIAPRIGFAYDLKGDSLHASVGRFYSLASNYIADYFNNVPTNQQYWSWKKTCTLDPAKKAWEYANSCWNLIYDVNLGASATLDSNLKPQYTDEFTIGYDKLLTDKFAAGVNFVYRNAPFVIDAYDPDETGVSRLCNFPKTCGSDIGNKYSEYQAMELSVKKRFAPDGFQFLVAYTHVFKSKSWLSDYRNAVPGTVGNQDANNPLWYGTMESPDEIKINGSYTMPWSTIVGLSAYYNTGNVYTPYHVNPATSYNVPDAERGSKRVGNNWEADIHIEHPVKIGAFSLAVYADLFNAFNNQQVTGRNSNTASASYKKPTGWQTPRSWQLGFKIDY